MKIGIVGSGLVGSTAAYAMVMQGIGREIVLVDKDPERAAAEANDIRHAVPFARALNIHGGDYEDLAGARAVIIAAGVSQRPGETRLQLLDRNAAVFREVVGRILAHAPQAILIVATNPVDVMTHLTTEYARRHGLPPQRVLGSGTTLDTARFRTLLATHFGIDSPHVHGYVLGEHGDSEVLNWSSVRIAGMSLAQLAALRKIPFTAEHRATIDHNVRRAAYQIIQGKGATYYGIGGALARIVRVILHNERAVLTVCTRMADVEGVHDTTVSLPHLIGGEGSMETFPIPLDEDEHAALRTSAATIREAIDSFEAVAT